MLFESVVINSVYYGTFFILYFIGAWKPTLLGIVLMFGIGNAFDSFVSGVAYASIIRGIGMMCMCGARGILNRTVKIINIAKIESFDD